MNEIETQIKNHQNNIKKYLEEQNQNNNTKQKKELNNYINKETEFIESLIIIKISIEEKEKEKKIKSGKFK